MKNMSGSVTDIRDGTIYRTITIGDQTWMAQDLAYSGPNGSLGWIQESPLIGKKAQGRLYDWEVLKNTGGGIKDNEEAFRVCPPGWHIPNKTEWDQLINAIDGNALLLKESVQKSASDIEQGDMAIGFDALASGYMDIDKKIKNNGKGCYFWTSSEKFPDYPWAIILEAGIIRQVYCVEVFKKMGLSVRCIRD